jgi:hypothetical protein
LLAVLTDFMALGRLASGLEEGRDFTVFPFESGMGLSLSDARSWRLSRAAQDEAGACAERDQSHSGTRHDLLRAVKAEAGGHGDDEVEQEQEPEHWPGGER